MDWATVFIGLGDYMAFSLTGKPQQYFDRLVERSRERCALILQLRLLSHTETTGIPNSVLRHWDVQRTQYRLYNAAADNAYVIDLLRGDRCFNDRELTAGIEQVTLSSASILDYDGEAVPAVLTSDLQLQLDKRTDFRRRNQLGQRDAVIVVRTPVAGGLQVFIGGEILNDPVDVMAGRLPGLSANEGFLDNLVRMAESAAASPPYARQVHDAFSQLERLLGRLVDEALREIKQTKRPEDFFPAKVRENIANGRAGRLEFGRCGYWDIVEIVRSNRELFAPFFIPFAGADFIGFLKPVNSNQRVWMAHPHKAEQEGKVFSDKDVTEIRSRLVATRQAYGMFLQKYRSTAA
jgi:hypothetical protein